MNHATFLATLFRCACFISLAVTLVLNPFYPFRSSNIATVITILTLLLAIWNEYFGKSTKVKVQLSCLLVFLLFLDANTGCITKALITIIEMKSPYSYLPFIVARIPIVILDRIVLPSILKYFIGIVILVTFWGFIGLLFYKAVRKNKNFRQRQVRSSYYSKNVIDTGPSEWKVLLLISCVAFFTRFLASVYYNPMPIGDDIWGNFKVLLGYYGYSSFEGTLRVYNSLPWNYAPLYAVGFRPFYYFFLYNLGQLWKISSDSIIFVEAIPILFNVLLSISIYGISLKITHNSKTSLVAGIISTFSIGQLLMIRINVQEVLGLLVMLCALYLYLILIDGKEVKRLRLFLLFFVMLNLVQFIHEQPFVILLTIILAHQTFCFLLQGWSQLVNINKKSFPTFLKQYFRNNSTGMYVIFAVIISLVIRYSYALFVRGDDVISLISSSLQETRCLPYCTLANMYGIPIVVFSLFGVPLVFESFTNRENKNFLIAFLFVAFIYIFQAPLGITINTSPNRIPEELYIPFVILAALGIDSLILDPTNTYFRIVFNLKWIKHKHYHISFNINFLKYFLIFLTFFSSCFVYITNSYRISREYIIYPTETLFTKYEYEGALWLKSNVDPSRTVVIADSTYYAAIHCLSNFKTIRFSPYFLYPFTDYNEKPIVTLNRIIEYWLSNDYNVVICQRNEDTLKDVNIPFQKIFDNGYVKFYMVKPKYQSYSFNASIPYENYVILNFNASTKNVIMQSYGVRLCYDSSLDNYVWYFNGINDYIKIPNSANLSDLNEITIEAWFKTTSGKESYIMSKLTGGWGWNTGYGLFIINDVVRAIFGKGGSGTNYYHLYSGMAINDGQWHHVVATAKPNDYAKIYVDGKIPDHPNAVQQTTTLALSNTTPIHIGEGFGNYFNGSIALIRIFSKALNETEVAELYRIFKRQYGILNVTHDGSSENIPLSFEGYGPLLVNASIRLKGYNNYVISNIPEYLNFKYISPNPISIEIGTNKISFTAENVEKEYTVMFECSMSYSDIGWKDETFLNGWLAWKNENGTYTTDGNILKIGKYFVFGSIDTFTLEKQINVDGKRFPYLLLKASGERSLEAALEGKVFPSLSIMLHTLDGTWIEIFNIQPTSKWDLYIARIPPLKYDKIAVQINNKNYYIEGYHEILLDYILFADWMQSLFWSTYYIKSDS